jgi:drug/metabolite transporter (DMT)-like permease
MNLPPGLSKTKLGAYFAAVLAIVLWGMSFVSIKIALEEVTPLSLILLRFTIAAGIIGLAAWSRKEWSQLKRSDFLPLAGIGLVGITLQQLLQVGGQARAQASVAGILAATAPALIVLLAAIFLRERQTNQRIIGVGLALIGAFLVVTNGKIGSVVLEPVSLQGSLLVLASSIVWAVFIILSKTAVHDRPAMPVTSALFIFGAFFTLPLWLAVRGWEDLMNISTTGWSAILFTAILCTGAAYLLNTFALKSISASQVAVIQTLEPLVAISTAVLVLGEEITLPILIGGVCILVGIVLSQRS